MKLDRRGKRLAQLGLVAVVALGTAMASEASPASAAVAATTPTVVVSPSSGLANGASVTVVGVGLLPNTVYHVGECATVAANTLACDQADSVNVTSSANGVAFGRLTVRSSFQGLVGRTGAVWGTVDCTTQACGVGLADDTGTSTGGASITFAAGAAPARAAVAAAAAPTVVVNPSSGLADGASVTVVGFGLLPNTVYHVGECATVAANTLACDQADSVNVTSSANGIAFGKLTVRKSYTGLVGRTGAVWGTVDCTTQACGVGLADDTGTSTAGMAIMFA